MSDVAAEHVALWLDRPKRNARIDEMRYLLFLWTGNRFEGETDSDVVRFFVAYRDFAAR